MAELTYEHVLELFAESDRRYQEQRVETNKQIAENDKRFDQKLEKVNKELGRRLSDLGDTLGRFAEEQVRADLINKFDKWGIPVHAITNHFTQRNNKNEFVYEVDILIYNSKYVVAIEVKNTLKKDHVDEHLERMQKIQAYPPRLTSKGEIFLGAVAGMIVSEGVDKYAESKGLFVLKPSGDTVKIVNDKKTFKPKEWVIK